MSTIATTNPPTGNICFGCGMPQHADDGPFTSTMVRGTIVVWCGGCPEPGKAEPTYGMCTSCGSIEVKLVKPTGTRDLSHIGESDKYPTGYGCELCA